MGATSRFKLLTGTAVATLLGAPAFAADLPLDEVPVELQKYWTGFYAAAGVSLNGLRGDLHGYGFDDFNKTYEEASVRDDDYGFGLVLELGYDHQVGNNIVLGVSVDGNWIFDDLKASGFSQDSYFDKSGGFDEELNYFGNVEGIVSLVGRAGVLVTPKTLLYGLGGAAWVKYKIGGNYWSDSEVGGPYGFSWARSGWKAGYTVGAGLETYLGQMSKTTFKFEYRYTDVGSVSTQFENCEGICWGGGTKFEPQIHSLIGKLSYRF
jgi:outer membrane immunogenic protein